MLVQHFSPSFSSTTTTTTIANSFTSPSLPALDINENTSTFTSSFNSKSTDFQQATERTMQMDCSEKFTMPLSNWPMKLTSLMDIHRKRFSQLNPRFKRQQPIEITLLQPVQHSFARPTFLPTPSRPEPRQQSRSKPTHGTRLPPAQLTQRASTAYVKHQQPSLVESNPPYITLANLTKILHVLQTETKMSDSEASMDTRTTTTTCSKQRVQQHLQETATRWWKSARSSDGRSAVLTPSTILPQRTSPTPAQLPSVDAHQPSPHPLPSMIVSNSRPRMCTPFASFNRTDSSDESETSTEIQSTTDVSKTSQPSKVLSVKSTRLEPIIMPPRSMRLYSTTHHRYYNNPNGMNILQQRRLIR